MNRIIAGAFIFLFLSLHLPSRAENYLLNGGQSSRIAYKLIQKIQPTAETVTVDLTFVEPQSFKSVTYNQEVSGFKISTTQEPRKKDSWIDIHGNRITKYSWAKPMRSFDIEIDLTVLNSVKLDKISTLAPFPVEKPAPELTPYLNPTALVPTDDPLIAARAKELALGAKTQYDVVQKILSFIIDHVDYVLTPPDYSARYTLDTGRGNCQNYSHLAAAMMRSVGIPVRIVNGITLKQPYDIALGNRTLTLNMAQGRHSWVEVYFPDLGWVPFDPQQTELFVSNRFIRVEIGADNEETVNDGLVRWTRQKGSLEVLAFEELIDAAFISDNVSIKGKQLDFGPQGLLLQPEVLAKFVPVQKPAVRIPQEFDQDRLAAMNFITAYRSGNIDFPEGINFAFQREQSTTDGDNIQELKKNFLVETAEYVTGRQQYCQVFTLEQPVKLTDIGIAMQKFGGSGRIWLELREDVNGNPGPIGATSVRIPLERLSSKPGYFWVDFDFAIQELVLTPDRYWISIGYEGTPVINWFYSYGKPVGSIDGTRYRDITGQNWDKSLGYEFIYRVTGLSGE